MRSPSTANKEQRPLAATRENFVQQLRPRRAKIINKMIKKKKKTIRARSRANINALPKPNTDLSAEGRTLASSVNQSTASDQILPAQ